MKQHNVTMYGSATCPNTSRARAFLDSQNVPYEYKDVEDDPSYNDYVASLNNGKYVIPTLRIDNETLVNPSDDELSGAIA